MNIDGVSVIAVIIIASFAIDRVVTALMFLLGFIKPLKKHFGDLATIEDNAERAATEKRKKLIYYLFAGVLGVVAVSYFGEVRIFSALGFTTGPYLDSIMTGLILVAGADRVTGMLKLPGSGGGGEQSASQPIEITGKLVLEGDVGARIAARSGEALSGHEED